jgi:hypothetical protein
LPEIRSATALTAYAVIMGVSGSITTLMFFATWGQAYGKPHLGQIQAVTQMMTVVASAVGPLLLAECFEALGSYSAIFHAVGGAAFLLAVASWLVRVPRPEDAAAPVSRLPALSFASEK